MTGMAILRRIRIPPAEDVQPVVVCIRMLSASDLQDQDTEWLLLRQQLDTGSMLEDCRKVEVRYMVLCFPCFSL